MRKNLKKKGWSEKEIEVHTRALHRSHLNKSFFARFFDSFVYWIAFFVSLIGNFLFSLIIIPWLLLLKGFWIYFVVFLFGIVFGMVFEFIVCTLEQVKKKHTIIPLLLFVAIGLINFYLITELSNKLSRAMFYSAGIQDSFWISVTYLIAFLIPYFVHKILLTQGFKIYYHKIT